MNHSLRRWLTLILLLLLVSLASNVVQADEPIARLDLQRSPIQDSQLLVIEIALNGVQNLYGAEIQISYPADQLAVQDNDPLTNGDQIILGQLLPEKDRLVVINSVDKANGVIKLVVTMLNPAPAISGSGTLASIIFQVKDNRHPIDLRFTNVKLVAANLASLPYEAHDLVLDINNDIAATPQSTVDPSATAVLTSTVTVINGNSGMFNGWGFIISGLVIGLIILLGAGLLWQRSQALEPPNQPAIRKMPSGNFSSSRSSSMLAYQGNEAMAQQNFEAAYEYFSQAVELDPANAEAWLGKGLVAQQESEKRICLQQALRLDPDNDTAKLALKQL